MAKQAQPFRVGKPMPTKEIPEGEDNIFRRLTRRTGVDWTLVNRRLVVACIYGCVSNGWLLSFSANKGLPGVRVSVWIDSQKHVEFAGDVAELHALLQLLLEAANGTSDDYITPLTTADPPIS